MVRYIDKIALMYFKDGKVLMTQKRGRSVFYNPGGKPDEGETDEQALIREIKEELSVDIIPETIKLYGRFQAHADAEPDDVMVRMTLYSAEFIGTLKSGREEKEFAYLGYSDLDKISAIGLLIFADAHEKGLLK